MAAANLVDGNDPELVVDVRGQLEDGRVDTAWELGVVMPDSRLELVLFKLDDIVWADKEDRAVLGAELADFFLASTPSWFPLVSRTSLGETKAQGEFPSRH